MLLSKVLFSASLIIGRNMAKRNKVSLLCNKAKQMAENDDEPKIPEWLMKTNYEFKYDDKEMNPEVLEWFKRDENEKYNSMMFMMIDNILNFTVSIIKVVFCGSAIFGMSVGIVILTC